MAPKSKNGYGLLVLSVLVATLPVRAGDPEGFELTPRQGRLFSQACAHCHLVPDIGVPVLGVDADWTERRARGFDSMLANTVNGVGNMPPLGTCGACVEADFRAMVAFLSGLEP